MSATYLSNYRRARKNRIGRTRYGAAYRATKKALRLVVDSGFARCMRCSELIEPGTPWDLGHDDYTGAIAGPEHARCNRGAPHKLNHSREW